MAGLRLLFLIITAAIAGSSPTLAEGDTAAVSTADTSIIRVRRTVHKKLCLKFGICGNSGYGGYGGHGGYSGYGGYDGHQGYGGYQGGYGQGYPINIAISQSQSSANEGYGGHAYGYYPNNYQYNGGYPNHGYYNSGYNRRPNNHGGYRPGFDNGNFAHNNQFNGNYYSGGPQGGHGYQGPFGFRGDSDGYDYDEGRSVGGASARSNAEARVKS